MNSRKPINIKLEMDEMWDRLYCKETPYWLWHAINHENGDVVVYVLDSRKREMLKQLNGMLNSLNLNITHVY